MKFWAMEGQFLPSDSINSLAPVVAEVPESCGWFECEILHAVVFHFQDNVPAVRKKGWTFFPTFPAKNVGINSGFHPYLKIGAQSSKSNRLFRKSGRTPRQRRRQYTQR